MGGHATSSPGLRTVSPGLSLWSQSYEVARAGQHQASPSTIDQSQSNLSSSSIVPNSSSIIASVPSTVTESTLSPAYLQGSSPATGNTVTAICGLNPYESRFMGSTYPRISSIYSSSYSEAPVTSPGYMTAFAAAAAAGPASMYPPLSHPYDMKESNGSNWTPLPSTACYSYDSSLYNAYGDRYGAMESAARRKNATRETTNTLKSWLYEHRKNPYPTKGEKIMLAIITKMTLTQVSTWFANARRRLKKENKMTWEPRNKSNDNQDADDKDSNNDSDDNSSSPVISDSLSVSGSTNSSSDPHHTYNSLKSVKTESNGLNSQCHKHLVHDRTPVKRPYNDGRIERDQASGRVIQRLDVHPRVVNDRVVKTENNHMNMDEVKSRMNPHQQHHHRPVLDHDMTNGPIHDVEVDGHPRDDCNDSQRPKIWSLAQTATSPAVVMGRSFKNSSSPPLSSSMSTEWIGAKVCRDPMNRDKLTPLTVSGYQHHHSHHHSHIQTLANLSSLPSSSSPSSSSPLVSHHHLSLIRNDGPECHLSNSRPGNWTSSIPLTSRTMNSCAYQMSTEGGLSGVDCSGGSIACGQKLIMSSPSSSPSVSSGDQPASSSPSSASSSMAKSSFSSSTTTNNGGGASNLQCTVTTGNNNNGLLSSQASGSPASTSLTASSMSSCMPPTSNENYSHHYSMPPPPPVAMQGSTETIRGCNSMNNNSCESISATTMNRSTTTTTSDPDGACELNSSSSTGDQCDVLPVNVNNSIFKQEHSNTFLGKVFTEYVSSSSPSPPQPQPQQPPPLPLPPPSCSSPHSNVQNLEMNANTFMSPSSSSSPASVANKNLSHSDHSIHSHSQHHHNSNQSSLPTPLLTSHHPLSHKQNYPYSTHHFNLAT
ncbi:uncharacterized protein LOC141856700 isoform X1 [Brevipalpus obovatus]|uniref:uncharacterized protein LOC141856700 isoform X1 n=1 Tax=Brevipalpus obovatus TaxID=246614 RepID=UPI003D9EBA81